MRCLRTMIPVLLLAAGCSYQPRPRPPGGYEAIAFQRDVRFGSFLFRAGSTFVADHLSDDGQSLFCGWVADTEETIVLRRHLCFHYRVGALAFPAPMRGIEVALRPGDVEERRGL